MDAQAANGMQVRAAAYAHTRIAPEIPVICKTRVAAKGHLNSSERARLSGRGRGWGRFK
jgi:hypothetical protein